MEKINVAELLKNCPEGMELDCLAWENLYFEKITDSNIFTFPIKCYVEQNGQKLPVSFTKEGTIFTDINSKCVIFPKGKTSWEGFVPPCEFKNGDIICTEPNDIVIIKDKLAFGYNAYCALREGGDFYLYAEVTPMRLATEEEKKRLLQAIKDNGYKWDAEKKCLEKLEKERFDISTFKPFDRVLVRDSDNGDWTCDLFSHYRGKVFYMFCCVSCNYRCCIPYAGNEHLCGTSDDCEEIYKIWED